MSTPRIFDTIIESSNVGERAGRESTRGYSPSAWNEYKGGEWVGRRLGSSEGFDIFRHEAGIAKSLSEATKGDEGKAWPKRHRPFPATHRRCVGVMKQQSVRPPNCHSYVVPGHRRVEIA